jgi:hypothetical protein
VTEDTIVFQTSGNDSITGIDVRSVTGTPITTMNALQRDSSAAVAFARGSIGGIVVSGTCDGHPISTTCISSNPCWNSTVTPAPESCQGKLIYGWTYNAFQNKCYGGTNIDACAGLNNVTTFESATACSNTAVISTWRDCYDGDVRLNVSRVTNDSITLINQGARPYDNITLYWFNPDWAVLGFVPSIAPGASSSVPWERLSNTSVMVVGICGWEDYATTCGSLDPCWE